MTQMDLGLNLSIKRTRKREFLDEMTRVVPWQKLIALIEPHYPKGKIGRPPFPIAASANSIHAKVVQPVGPGEEEALHDIPLYRQFALLDAGMTRLPDQSTILRFRHLLEAHQLSAKMLATVNEILQAKGLMLKAGSAVDATLIAAPSSTKKPGTRDPEMRQTKKGGSWYFGMKAHIGVDDQSGR